MFIPNKRRKNSINTFLVKFNGAYGYPKDAGGLSDNTSIVDVAYINYTHLSFNYMHHYNIH